MHRRGDDSTHQRHARHVRTAGVARVRRILRSPTYLQRCFEPAGENIGNVEVLLSIQIIYPSLSLIQTADGSAAVAKL